MAGMIEHRTVELLRAHGLAETILRRGGQIGMCEFRADGEVYVLDYAALCGDRGHYIYPQQALVGDWAEQLLAAGGEIRFGVHAVGIEQHEDGVQVRAVVSDGVALTIECEVVACCDGATSSFTGDCDEASIYGENAGGVRLRVGPRASGRAGGPTWQVAVCRAVTGSGGGLESDLVAERFELFDEPSGSVFG